MELRASQDKISSTQIKDGLRTFHHNGFAVFRDVFSKSDAESIYGRIEQNTKIVSGETITDVANVDPTSESLVYAAPVLSCVRRCIGDDIGFLKMSTYQIDHTSHPWHRDAAYRDYGVGMDWQDPPSYLIAKAILYLRCEQFALAVMPNSHRLDIDRMSITRDRDDYFDVAEFDEINEPLFDDGDQKPTLVKVNPGDIIVFDQRLLHCGRNLDDNNHNFVKEVAGPKHFFSAVYGAKNSHSERFYSYYEFERGYSKGLYNKKFRDKLEELHILYPFIEENYFEYHPEDREGMLVLPSTPPPSPSAASSPPTPVGDKPPASCLTALTRGGRAQD